jgi:hypothetical protein
MEAKMSHQWIRMAVVVLAVAGIASCGGTDHGATTTTSESSGIGSTTLAGASAVDVARGFVDAYGAFDADRALSFLTDEVVAARWDSPESFRLHLDVLKAMGYEQAITGCAPSGQSGARCDYDFQAIRSGELGLGPYTGNTWDFGVRDGRIAALAQVIAYEANGFSDQVWEPFAEWIATIHPGDVATMYDGPGQSDFRPTEESARLWEQRSREYAQAHAPGTAPVTTG